MIEKSWPAVFESIPKICRFVYLQALSVGFDKGKAQQLELAVEEMAANIVRHTHAGSSSHVIHVALEKSSSHMILRLSDPGKPFNPLAHPEPDVSASLEKRKPGGLGIFLAKNMVDWINYIRVRNQNVLTFVKFS